MRVTLWQNLSLATGIYMYNQCFIQKFSRGGGAIKNVLGSCGDKHKTSVIYLEVSREGKQISRGGKSPLPPPPPPLKETLTIIMFSSLIVRPSQVWIQGLIKSKLLTLLGYDTGFQSRLHEQGERERVHGQVEEAYDHHGQHE